MKKFISALMVLVTIFSMFSITAFAEISEDVIECDSDTVFYMEDDTKEKEALKIFTITSKTSQYYHYSLQISSNNKIANIYFIDSSKVLKADNLLDPTNEAAIVHKNMINTHESVDYINGLVQLTGGVKHYIVIAESTVSSSVFPTFTENTLSIYPHNHSYQVKFEGGEKYDYCSECGYKRFYEKVTNYSLSFNKFTYDGKVKKPTVIVRDKEDNKIPSSYYSVEYSNANSKNAGKYKVTVILDKYPYYGSKTLYYYINPLKATSCSAVLSKTDFVYNGKQKTPTVTVKNSKGVRLTKNKDYTLTYSKGRKNVGKYSVKINFKGNYAGSKVLYFRVKPKSTNISKLTSGKKKLTVKWNKRITQVSGYQIQYSTNKKFNNAKTVTINKNKTTSKTISKLKAKKKYYVRIRTYKNVKINGKTYKYYSQWSKTKNIKTK